MTTLYQRSWPQMNETPDSLLATDEPPPFTVDNENGTSPLLIVADHAGKHFPQRLGQLGLSNAECGRHIAWDIGVGAGCCLIGKALNAVVVRQNYSRLVIDCNRTPGSGTSILDLSELTRVPGNIGLSERHKLARVREIFRPYHDRIATELDRRREAARPTALISVHSFTPVFKTGARLWHVGVLYKTLGLPTGLRDLQRQYARNPARCQRTTVAGLTIAIAARSEGNQRYSQTKSSRSVLLRRGRFGACRRSTLTCWRRTRFSASSLALDLKSDPRTWRISLNKSIIRSQAYPVCSLRPSRIEFSVHTAQPQERPMRTHRFGRKIKLPATIAIKHQIRKLMFEDAVKKAEAGARAEAICGQPSEELLVK